MRILRFIRNFALIPPVCSLPGGGSKRTSEESELSQVRSMRSKLFFNRLVILGEVPKKKYVF